MNEVLQYRSFVRKLLIALRLRLSEDRARVIPDKVLARYIGVSPSEFSRVFSGVVALSSLAFFRLLLLCKQYNLSIDERLDGQLTINFMD